MTSLGYYKQCISVSGSPPTSFWTAPIYEHSVRKLSTGQIKVVSCISCLDTSVLLCFKLNYQKFFFSYIAMCLFAGKYICFDATGVADIPPSCIVAEKS